MQLKFPVHSYFPNPRVSGPKLATIPWYNFMLDRFLDWLDSDAIE